MSNQPETSIDYDRLMQANLGRVFNERDAKRRIAAVRELYAEDAVLYEQDSAAKGHPAIDAAAASVLSSLPPDFAFKAIGPAIGHHGIGRLRWQAGPPNGPVAVTGMDVAYFANGRIHSLYVFLEPAA